MPSYESQFKTEVSTHPYSMDQYEQSDSCSNSPQTHYSTLFKVRENFPNPCTDSSNEPDESSNVGQFCNLNTYDPYKFMKLGDNLNNFYNGINPLEQIFNDGRANINGEHILQSYSAANFDPNIAPGRLSVSSSISDSESKPPTLSPSPRITNKEIVSQKYLMQPPDSDSIEAATANAKRKRPQRRSRTKFEKEQLDILESTFQKNHYPDVNLIDRISRMCNLTTERVSVWFQNRRARFKRTKKEIKEETVVPDHNPILEELGLYNSSELEKNNYNKIEEQKNENEPNGLNESGKESETSNPEENVNHVHKPIFNPMTLSNSISNQNSSQNFHMPSIKTDPYFYQDSNNQIEKSQLNEPADEQNKSFSVSSQKSSPEPQSNYSTPSPNPGQLYQHNYAQLPSVINHYNALPPMMNYQSNFGNFYMPPFQTYAQNLPNILHPYMDIQSYKPDISNLGNLHALNPQTLPSYYGSF